MLIVFDILCENVSMKYIADIRARQYNTAK